jgi:phosphohistidine phosphatase SixA
MKFRAFVPALVAATQLAAPRLQGQTVDQPTTPAMSADSIVSLLRSGGLIIVFRHAHTDRSKMDQRNFSLADRATQRNLSEKGVEQAVHIGERVRALHVPIGQVLASPMFRTFESATHAFGRADTTELLRDRGSSAEARELLTRAVPAGENRVLVTHNAFLHQHLEAALGRASVEEGDAVIVRPLATRFEVLGLLRVADWDESRGTSR